MADDDSPVARKFFLLQDPILYLSLLVAGAAILCFWIARAPTIYTGKLPFIGDALPLRLNAIYFIEFGPPAIFLATCALRFEMGQKEATRPSRLQRQQMRRNAIPLALFFLAIAIFAAALSLQYFLIVAPAELCPSRPHFEFLWTNLPPNTRMTHCMSGTEQINAEAPYYISSQIAQAWIEVAASVFTLVLLITGWRSWWRMSSEVSRRA